MPRLLVEPPALAADAQRTRKRQGTPRVDDLTLSGKKARGLLASRPADPRAAFACAGLAAAVVGVLGPPAGLIWLVVGVWAVRTVAGGPVGVGWGVAAAGVGLRWGTLSLGDVEVATRIAGPTVATGPAVVRAGMALALVAALCDEARSDGFLASAWTERAAAGVVAASIGPLFVLRGPSDPGPLAVVWWVLAAAAATTVVLLGRPVLRRIPAWAPALAAALGVVAGVAGS